MRPAPALFALASVLALMACDSSMPDEEQLTADVQGRPSGALPDNLAVSEPSATELAQLENPECTEVADAYVEALGRGAFDYAARFWNDPVIDGERLSALFSDYVTPQITVSNAQEEGAAGTLYCTVTGRLVDGSNSKVAPEQGEIVLSRVNDVPGATEHQLRWTIRSSNFVEQMERSNRETPG